jgi:hypothetical protein
MINRMKKVSGALREAAARGKPLRGVICYLLSVIWAAGSPFGVGPRNISSLQIVKPQKSPKFVLRSPFLTSKKPL